MMKLTRSVIVSAAGLLLLAGGVTYSFNCGIVTCCCAPETTGDLAFQQGHCGCGCGHFENSQVPDQNAVTVAISDTKPVQTKFEYVIEKEDSIFEDTNLVAIDNEISSHSPPLILDNRYKPLLC